jgi:hypothetical protein
VTARSDILRCVAYLSGLPRAREQRAWQAIQSAFVDGRRRKNEDRERASPFSFWFRNFGSRERHTRPPAHHDCRFVGKRERAGIKPRSSLRSPLVTKRAGIPLGVVIEEDHVAGMGRAQIEENIVQCHMSPTQRGKRMSQGLRGVQEAATERKQERFTALLHHLTIDLLRDSFHALQRRAAPGVDGMTWQEYETGLKVRLIDLHNRVHRRAYRAQPSRRVYIPKADGRQRPLGIAALEDKIVQQAVVTILNQIYEVDFKGFSYGFRRGRSPMAYG